PTIVLGGPQVTESRNSAALALRGRLADHIVLGEGEASLLELYSTIASGGACTRPVAGTVTLSSDGAISVGLPRPLLPADNIPVPYFGQMCLLSYERTQGLTLPYHLSRGCTDRCTFCSEWTFWERFRPGDSARTIAGVKELRRR